MHIFVTKPVKINHVLTQICSIITYNVIEQKFHLSLQNLMETVLKFTQSIELRIKYNQVQFVLTWHARSHCYFYPLTIHNTSAAYSSYILRKTIRAGERWKHLH